MSDKKQLLPLDGCADLLSQMVGDFAEMSKEGSAVPEKRIYKVASSEEPPGVTRSARKAAFLRLYNAPIQKYAFDARKTDQDSERNPRHNLQYYSRSQQYIDEEDQKRLEAFARLVKPLDAIKDKYGSHPEYFDSHARKLRENVKTILKVRESDMDIFRPQMDYLEQLLYARYRISAEDLEKMSSEMLKNRILSKDEDLLKRGSFMHVTGNPEDDKQRNRSKVFVKDSDGGKITQDSIVNAIFGNNNFRRDGEKKVERTITITIRDEVLNE